MDRTVNDVIDDIVEVLEGDTNAKSFGNILKRPRSGVYENDHREAMIDVDAALRATVITTPRVREFEDEARRKVWGFQTYNIMHYYQFSDKFNTERDFNTQMDHLRQALRSNATVFGIPHRPEVQRTIETADPTIVMLGDRLVHQGMVSLTVETSDGL